MKRLAALIVLLMFPVLLRAQSCTPGGGVTCTPNLNLWLLPHGYLNWDVPWNDNANIVDTLPTLMVLLNPTASQTVTQPAATYTNFNTPLVFGTTPALLFGTAAGNPSAYLTLASAGNFTLDTSTKGNFQANLKLHQMNAQTGYQVNGSAGSVGQCLASDGTNYNTPVNCLTSLAVNYQTVYLAGVAQTQRQGLNFTSRFTASDSSIPSETTIDLATVGTAGTYTSPASITFDAYGRETAVVASSAVNRVCNANGCYRIEADGTIFQWGNSSTLGVATSAATLTITFPIAFTTTTNLSPEATAISDATGDGNPHPADCHIQRSTITTTGATAIISASVQIGGSGYANLAAGDYCSWQATGR